MSDDDESVRVEPGRASLTLMPKRNDGKFGGRKKKRSRRLQHQSFCRPLLSKR
jgi:hypothetical protein